MKILHFIPSMGGGGAERQLAYLAGASVQRGHQVHVALLSGGPNLEYLRRTGAAIHIERNRSHRDPRTAVAWQKIANEVRPDVVHTWLMYSDLVGGLIALGAGVPWILSERCNASAYAAVQLRRRFRERLGRRAAAVVSNSQGGDDYWRAVLPAAARRFLVPNAIPPETYLARPLERARFTSDPDEKVVLVVGRLSAQKNLSVLFTAMAQLASLCRVQLLVLGDGEERARLQKLANRLQARVRITLAGYQPQVWPFMRAADVMVSTSLFEGQPNAVLEAMALRCPLVLSDIPEHRSMVPDQAAYFVKPDDDADIMRGLLHMLLNREDARRRAECAFRTSLHFTVEAMADRYDQIYHELCA